MCCIGRRCKGAILRFRTLRWSFLVVKCCYSAREIEDPADMLLCISSDQSVTWFYNTYFVLLTRHPWCAGCAASSPSGVLCLTMGWRDRHRTTSTLGRNRELYLLAHSQHVLAEMIAVAIPQAASTAQWLCSCFLPFVSLLVSEKSWVVTRVGTYEQPRHLHSRSPKFVHEARRQDIPPCG